MACVCGHSRLDHGSYFAGINACGKCACADFKAADPTVRKLSDEEYMAHYEVWEQHREAHS